jgi:hypothetical protein
MRPHRESGRTALAVAVAVLAVTAGCSNSPEPPIAAGPSPRSTESPSPGTGPTRQPSPDPTERAGAAVLAAYRNFRQAEAEVLADYDVGASQLRRYAIDRARADVQSTVLLFQQEGIVMRGRPRLDPVVTALRSQPTPRATIRDCLDSTDWEAVYADTGKSAVAPGQPERVVIEATATVYEGRWVVEDVVVQRDRPC